MDSLWKETGKPVPWHVEKAEVLSHVSDSAFMASCSSHTIQVAGGKGREWENKEPPAVGEDWGQEGLMDLKELKSMGPDETHPRVQRDWWKEWLGHYLSYLRSCGSPEKFPLMPKGENITQLFLERGIRKIQRTTGSQVSPQWLERAWSRSSWKQC